MSATGPRTARGIATKAKLLQAAETVFARVGYTEASIVRITEEAGVGQGTFYLYFDGKFAVFEEVVDDLNRRVRHSMSEAALKGTTRTEAERLGFEGLVEFTAAHPALCRIVREAEFVSPRALRRHYTGIVEGYTEVLERARAAGEIDADPTVAAWILLGIGEMVGMRWVVWGDRAEGTEDGPLDHAAEVVPQALLDEMMRFIHAGLGTRPPGSDSETKQEAQ